MVAFSRALEETNEDFPSKAAVDKNLDLSVCVALALMVAVAFSEDADKDECSVPDVAVDKEWEVLAAFSEVLEEDFSTETSVDLSVSVALALMVAVSFLEVDLAVAKV